MLYSSISPNFQWEYHSHDTTRPGSSYGTIVTAAGSSHTKGSYTGIVTTPTAYDTYMIWININSGTQSAVNNQGLMDIAIDPAGGTSYTELIIPDLYVTNAGNYNTIGSGGIYYIFPLFIPAGATIAARVQSNTASRTYRVNMRLMGLPTNPEMVRFGTKVEALGVNSASSAGTLITMGTTSEGAWTSIASPTYDTWWWQIGYGAADKSTSSVTYHLDVGVGDATNKKIVVKDFPVFVSGVEEQYTLPFAVGAYGIGTPSDTVYARGQSSGAVDSNTSVIVYALSG
ncbi:MAG: hypothetical protein KDH96_02085 [Candidatus Riesia sp.]|nr:hypothetical protein [Candidatus Riesia sp.]